MSHYTDYDTVSKLYDRTRKPVGLHVYVGGIVSLLDKPLNQVHLLDLGCGTGSYAKSMLDLGVGKISLLDGSKGMLEVAKEKVKQYGGRVVQAELGVLPKIPFKDAEFDCVMINQVLHHLTDVSSDNDRFQAIKETLKEVRRVVKLGGVLIINNSSPRQQLEAFWWSKLIPEAMIRLTRRHISNQDLNLWLSESSFKPNESYVPLRGVLLGERYFDGEGPLKPEFRDGDSFWSNVTPGELEVAMATVEKYKREGRATDEMKRMDAMREVYGQCTVIVSVAV